MSLKKSENGGSASTKNVAQERGGPWGRNTNFVWKNRSPILKKEKRITKA